MYLLHRRSAVHIHIQRYHNIVPSPDSNSVVMAAMSRRSEWQSRCWIIFVFRSGICWASCTGFCSSLWVIPFLCWLLPGKPWDVNSKNFKKISPCWAPTAMQSSQPKITGVSKLIRIYRNSANPCLEPLLRIRALCFFLEPFFGTLEPLLGSLTWNLRTWNISSKPLAAWNLHLKPFVWNFGTSCTLLPQSAQGPRA